MHARLFFSCDFSSLHALITPARFYFFSLIFAASTLLFLKNPTILHQNETATNI